MIKCKECGRFMGHIDQEDDGIIACCNDCGIFEVDEEATNRFWNSVDKQRIEENPLWLNRLQEVSSHDNR